MFNNDTSELRLLTLKSKTLHAHYKINNINFEIHTHVHSDNTKQKQNIISQQTKLYLLELFFG